ncbi:hypothetical protein NA56DRAFT_525834, partial [Hyaloscypha hepaticicola]
KAIKYWENIYSTFIQCTLTYISDRALVISGIIQIFAELTSNQYTTSLWKLYLYSGLLW